MDVVKVFIGSSTDARNKGVLDKLGSWLGTIDNVEVNRWDEPRMFPLGTFIFPRLMEIASNVDAAILVFAEDDLLWHGDLVPGVDKAVPRDNVLIEYGLFVGALGSTDRVAVVRYGQPRNPSDLGGLIHLQLENEGLARKQLRDWIDGLRSRPAGPPGDGATRSDELSAAEELALGLILSDPAGTSRGAWLYPLHQQLEYRGLTQAAASLALDSLVRRAFVENVDVPATDPLDGSSGTAPAVRVTASGARYSETSDAVMGFRTDYNYWLELSAEEDDARPLLDDIRALPGVQAQTRFVTSRALQSLSAIAVWSYQPLDCDALVAMARKRGIAVVSLTDR